MLANRSSRRRVRPPRPAARRRMRAGWRRWCGRRRRAAPAPGRGPTGSTRMRPARRRSRAAAPSCRGAGPTRRRQAFTRQVGAAGERPCEQRRRVEPARARPGARGRHRHDRLRIQQRRGRRGGHLRRHRLGQGELAAELQRLHAGASRAGVGHRRPRRVEGQALRRTGRARQRQGAARAARRPQPRAALAGSRRTAPRPPRPPARRTRVQAGGAKTATSSARTGCMGTHAARRRATGHARIATIDPALLAVSYAWTFDPGPILAVAVAGTDLRRPLAAGAARRTGRAAPGPGAWSRSWPAWP